MSQMMYDQRRNQSKWKFAVFIKSIQQDFLAFEDIVLFIHCTINSMKLYILRLYFYVYALGSKSTEINILKVDKKSIYIT